MNYVRAIAEDANGMLWLGSSEGLCIVHPDSLMAGKEGRRFSFNNRLFCSNEIRYIYQDSKQRMWVGTSGAGLVLCSLEDNYQQLNFRQFTTADGLVDDIVHSILTDSLDNLWIATEYGISRFDPKAESFESFFFSPHVSGNTYQESSACAGDGGKLLFGTDYGLTIINPNTLPVNSGFSPVVLTRIYINGSPVSPSMKDFPLENSPAYSDLLSLKSYQNSILLDFTNLDYTDNKRTQYTYWLENYDNTWSTPSHESTATYKYLSPGTYYFHVKASSGIGTWNDQVTVMKIVVHPPFWQSNWAICIYLLLIIIASYTAYRVIFSFNILRTRIRIEEQLTEYKLKFFTNISHEFRTPLTLIRGALEKMQAVADVPVEMSSPMHTMDKSTQRMLRLVNQLLTFRKVQNNKLVLSLEETDVVAFLYEIYLSFGDVAEQKRMSFSFQASVPSYKMYIDKDSLDKVAYNLLSNAFKYTPEGGKVQFDVTVDEESHQLFIRVSDTGMGVPREKQGELFSRFMQSSFSHDSIGVGLHLTHELVTIHKGSITYAENPGGGSVFTVCLPTSKDVYEEKDFLSATRLTKEQTAGEATDNLSADNDADSLSSAAPDASFLPFTDEERVQLERATGPLNQRKILVIEDDPDVRQFLQDEIGAYFHVETAENGLAGLEKAREWEPDLIVCDVMMPGMNGFKVTYRLKHNFETSHIPIILLTALSSIEKQTEGINAGADAYISKPFRIKFLLTRIFRMIEQREKLREKFTNEPGMVHTAMYNTDSDRDFVDRMNIVIDANMHRPEFSIDDFARQMKIGRTAFYKKVKGLTGYAPVEYIRILRMKKAAELLLSPENLNVSEVSFRIGFTDPLYFSKCFKMQFGMAPSVYQKGGKPAEEE